MILQALHQLYDRLEKDESYDLAQPGFSPQKVSFKVVLNRDGTLHEIQDARVKDEKGKLVPDRSRVPGDAKPSGAGINPCFLWDNQTYLLGMQPEGKAEGFGRKRFEAFRDRHLKAEREIDHPAFSAVCRFLETWKTESMGEHPILDEVGPGFGVFQLIDDKPYVHKDEAIRAWWRENQENQPKAASDIEAQCLLTGEVTAIARLHPKIKGVRGAQSVGASIVSFNDRAYESYGKSQSYNSPVGENAAFRYGTALNALLSGPRSGKHRMQIGDTTCVFWTDQPTVLEDVWADVSAAGSGLIDDEAQDEEIRKKVSIFLDALRKGRDADVNLADDPKQTKFYILGLAPNAARLSIRFFYQSNVHELLKHLREHKEAFGIVRQFEKPVGKRRADPEFPAWWEFLRETARDGDDPPPLLGGALMRSILEGSAYPESLLSAVVRRVHMERRVNYLRAAAIKAVLVRNRNHRQPIQIMLDRDNKEPAYRLGRLFAVLEKIQEEGHREQTGVRQLDKTIRDTYFSAACATPAAVFPRLEVLSIHHQRHLNPGRKTQFDKLISDIKWEQTGTARTHNLKEQGLFILGYYHQRKDLFTGKPKDSQTETATT